MWQWPRSIAQFGSARGLGPWGSGFESLYSDCVCSSIGGAVDCGSTGCRFESGHAPKLRKRMRGSLALSISQYYRMLLFRTCSPTAEASGLSPVQCEFESHQVYLCVEMAKMVDAAGSNPVGFNPSEFESRFPHLRRITRKAQRRYLGYHDDKFVGSNPTSGTM